MPRVHLIVRFDASSDKKPAFETTDITTTDEQVDSKADDSHVTTTYTIIDDQAGELYHVAVNIPRKKNDNVHVSYGSRSRENVLQRFAKIPDYMKESDVKRTEHQRDHVDKAVITRWGETCIRIKLRKDSFMWYEVVAVGVEADGDENERPKARKQKKQVSFA